MKKDDLLAHLTDLETQLHSPVNRNDRCFLERILHPKFKEFGRSGRFYRREDIIRLLLEETTAAQTWSQDFALERVGENAALLTYRSASINQSNTLERHANRSSLWVSVNGKWQIFFHQGSPTDAFMEKHPDFPPNPETSLRPA